MRCGTGFRLIVVPPVPGATQRPPKPTKRIMWNHVRGVGAVKPREQPQFRDVAPTIHDLLWQLTQATRGGNRMGSAGPTETRQNDMAPGRTCGTTGCT